MFHAASVISKISCHIKRFALIDELTILATCVILFHYNMFCETSSGGKSPIQELASFASKLIQTSIYHFSRFDVSKWTHMPLDTIALQCVLNNLPSDNEWDKTDPMQKAMFEAGELRYDLNALQCS